MFATAHTTVRWLKMTNLKNCSKKCSCAENLRFLYVTKPKTGGMEFYLNKRIEFAEGTYRKCFDKQVK